MCGPPLQLCNLPSTSHDPFAMFSSLSPTFLVHIHDANICNFYFADNSVEALILGLNVHISRQKEEATYVEILLVLQSKCLELSFPPTFAGVSL